jgi:hypothetical protein
MLQSILTLEPELNSFCIAVGMYSVRLPFSKSYKANVKAIDESMWILKQSHKVDEIALPDLTLLKLFHIYIKLGYNDLFEKYAYLTNSKDFEKTYLDNVFYLSCRLEFVKTKYEKQMYLNRIKDLQTIFMLYMEFKHLYFGE